MTTELSRFSRILSGNRPYCDGALDLAFGDCVLRLRTNSELLRDLLRHYFRHVLSQSRSRSSSWLDFLTSAGCP